MHRKYTYKNGKRYGPYLYETRRVDGEVVTTYLGRATETSKKSWLFLSALLFGITFALIVLSSLTQAPVVGVDFSGITRDFYGYITGFSVEGDEGSDSGDSESSESDESEESGESDSDSEDESSSSSEDSSDEGESPSDSDLVTDESSDEVSVSDASEPAEGTSEPEETPEQEVMDEVEEPEEESSDSDNGDVPAETENPLDESANQTSGAEEIDQQSDESNQTGSDEDSSGEGTGNEEIVADEPTSGSGEIPFGIGNETDSGNQNVSLNVADSPQNISIAGTNVSEVLNNESVVVNTNETVSIDENASFAIAVEVTQFGAVLGQPVRWVKTVEVNGSGSSMLTVEIPESAENVSVTAVTEENAVNVSEEQLTASQEESDTFNDGEGSDETAPEITITLSGAVVRDISQEYEFSFVEWFSRLFRFTGRVVEDIENDELVQEVSVDVNDSVEEVAIEYFTDAPYALETDFDDGKEVKIVGPDDVHYQNVLVFTQLSEALRISDQSLIQIYWEENDTFVPPVTVADINNNGFYDYVEWVAPHLSNQTFRIIVITDAYHLDANRSFISDIFDDVRELDGNLSETIPANDYVRVTFEVNLTSDRDITVWPRIVNGAPRIEIYEMNGTDLIAEFVSLVNNTYNKVYLDDLVGEQDTFDLLILEGDVKFDHIIDPQPPQGEFFEDCANILDWTVTGGWSPSVGQCRSVSTSESTMTSTEINLSASLAANLSFDYNYNHGFGGGNFRVFVSNDTVNYVLAYEQTSTGSGTFEFDLEDNITFTDEVTLRANCTASFGGGSCIWDNINVTSYDRTELTECATIVEDGFVYTLQNNITIGGTCFDVDANNVVIDGNGYSITGNGSGSGIDASNDAGASTNRNLTVRNITLSNFSTSITTEGVTAGYQGGDLLLLDSIVGDIDATGQASGAGNGGDAGNVNIFSSEFSEVLTRGGAASGFSGDGGDAGSIWIQGTDFNISNSRLHLTGGTGSLGGSEGADGRLTLNYSSSFDDTNATYVADMFLTITNSSADGGQIEWFTVKDMDGFSNLSAHIQISDNFVSVDSTVLTILNASANVSLFGSPAPGGEPLILRDGVACAAAICHNFTPLTDATVVFNVSYWSNHSLGDDTTVEDCRELGAANTVYTVQNNISTTGTCFTITASNVTLNGAGFTIDGDDGTSDYGVDATVIASNITVRNLSIEDFGTGVYFQSVSSSFISDVTTISNSVSGIRLGSANVSRFISLHDFGGILFDLGSSSYVVDSLIENSTTEAIHLRQNSNDNNFVNVSINGTSGSAIVLERVVSKFPERNVFTNVSVNNAAVSAYDVEFIGSGASGIGETTFVNTHLANYTFDTQGGLAVFEDTNEGRIAFLDEVTGSGMNLSNDVRISFNSVVVESISNNGLNVSANVTLYNTPSGGGSQSFLARDGVACAAAICHNFTALTDATVVFNVSYWTNYSVEENISLTDCAVLSAANTVYTVQNNISTTGTCFTITASNVTLNGAGFTIDGDDGTSDYGIDVSTSVTNVTVSNLSIEDFGAGVYFVGASNSFADTVRITSSSQYGVRTGSTNNFSSIVSTNDNQAFYLSGNRDNYIRDSVIENSSAESITVRANSDRNNFINVSVNSSGGDAIVLERVVTQTPDDNVFTNMTVSNTAGGAYDIQSIGSGGNGVDGITLINTHLANYTFASQGGILTFEDTGEGEIQFLEDVSGSGINLSDDVFIGSNLARVESTNNVGLNASANVSFYGGPGIGLSKPRLERDSAACATNICHNFTALDVAIVVFNVSYWTNYSVGDGNPAPGISFTNPTPGNGTVQVNADIPINVTSSDNADHYAFLEVGNDVVFWMRMDDTNASGDPTDLSNYNNNGSLVGDAVINTTGYWSNGSHYDQSGDYIHVGDPSGGELDFANGSFSVSAWFNADSAGAGSDWRNIVAKKAGGGTNVGWVIRVDNVNNIEFFLADGSTTRTIEGDTIQHDVWYHVVAVVDKSVNQHYLYLNGVLNASGAGKSSVNSSASFRIGSWDEGGNPDYWRGMIDEVIVFNRSLSQAEALSLYNASANKYFRNFTGLADGTYSFRGYAVDDAASRNNTEARIVTVDSTIDKVNPTILFVNATPANGTTLFDTSFSVNVSSSDVNNRSVQQDHYTFVDFDRSTTLWMRMDDTNASGDPVDLSHRSHNGTLSGNALINSTGRFGNASHYDGNGDYILLPASNALVSDQSAWSVGTWFNARAISNGNFANRIFTFANSSSFSAISLTLGGSNQLQFFYRDQSGNGVTQNITGISTGVWHHYAVTYNGSTYQIYVNGVLNTSIVDTLSVFSADRAKIASNPATDNNFFNGSIDEVLVFNRTLESAEISSIYNATATKYFRDFTGLGDGTYRFTGYAVDTAANRNQTEERTVTIEGNADQVRPAIRFTSPTPVNGSVPQFDISVNISSSDVNNQSVQQDHYAFVDFDDSLILWYRFDDLNGSGNVVDLSHYADNGTRFGGIVINSTGRFGNASHYDGNDDYIDIPDVDTVFTSGLSSCSWVYWNSFSESWSRVFDFGQGQADDNILFAHQGTTSNLAYEVYVGGTGGNQVIATSALSTGVWQHLCVSQATNASVKLYVNGANVANGTANSPAAVTRQNAYLGRSNWGFDGNLSGRIDEFLLFNRSLNPSEILSLYNATANQYLNDFENLGLGDHQFIGHAVDVSGNRNSTERRHITSNTAPITPTPRLNSTDLSNRTLQDLHGFDTLLDDDNHTMNVSVRWYNGSVLYVAKDFNNSYKNGTLFVATLEAPNTTKDQDWIVSMRVFDGISYSSWVNSTALTILNTPPTVSLQTPPNNNITTDRTPFFEWTGSDDDGDGIGYELNVSLVASSTCTDSDRYIQKLTNPNHTLTSDLLCFSDNNDYYIWSVRANDSEGFGDWSSTFALNISAVVDVSLPTSTIVFGSINILTSNDTTNNSPPPFVIQNDGNARVNVTISATNLWSSVSNPTTNYQFKVDNVTGETGSFVWSLSTTSFTNLPISDTVSIVALNHTDATDSAEIDIRVQVPANEPPGTRSSNITLISSLGE